MSTRKTELKTLAEFAAGFRLEEAPKDAVHAAEACVLDTIGAALGAAGLSETGKLCRAVAAFGKGGRHQAVVWGYNGTLNLNEAVFLNAMMGHSLEFDDVHAESKSHIGTVVIPAAWGCAEALLKDGKCFLEAVIIGYEVMGRIGAAMDVASNRTRGWHTTGITGTFGAAAAAGKLMGLSAEQMVSALGMAGTQSSGLWAFLEDGASCKKLHPARAAVNGVAAAILAKGGMTGPEHILDAGDGGLFRAVTDCFDLERLTKGLGTDYAVLCMDKKPYPCCRTTHPAIDAALRLRNEADASEIARIEVETYAVGVLQCGTEKYPENGEQARFSIPYTVAAALTRGRVTQEEFSRKTLMEGGIRRLAENTIVKEAKEFSELYPERWGSRMTLFLKDGRKKSCRIDDMSGSVRNPLSEKQETDKFTGLAAKVFDEETCGELEKTLRDIRSQSRMPALFGKGIL